MSQFKTIINLPIDALLSRLPEGRHIDGVTGITLSPDKQSVIVEWGHDDWKTPYSWPFELTVAQIEGREDLPELVTPPEGFKRVQNPEVAPKRPRKAQTEQ